jgi:probable phosphoglycerate mutase
MLLLACRHGNTFAAAEKAVWIGRNEDLPLTEKGEQQARDLARAVGSVQLLPHVIVAAPLKRTSRFAAILAETLGLGSPVVTDERLTELDYGSWSGLTSEEIRAHGGQEELDAWESRGEWPTRAGWSQTEAEVQGQLLSFLDELVIRYGSNAVVALVTSSGRLRMLLKLVPPVLEKQIEAGTLKVATGHACLLSRRADALVVLGWNLNPIQLEQALAAMPGETRKNP